METVFQSRAQMNGIYPQSLNSSRASTGSIDMKKSKRAFFTLYIGAVTSGSISAWLQESTDDSTWTANDTAGSFSGSDGTNVSKTGMTTSSSIVNFEVRADQLSNGYRYVRLQVKETAGSATIVCVTAEGCRGDFSPHSLLNGSHQATNGGEYVVA